MAPVPPKAVAVCKLCGRPSILCICPACARRIRRDALHQEIDDEVEGKKTRWHITRES